MCTNQHESADVERPITQTFVPEMTSKCIIVSPSLHRRRCWNKVHMQNLDSVWSVCVCLLRVQFVWVTFCTLKINSNMRKSAEATTPQHNFDLTPPAQATTFNRTKLTTPTVPHSCPVACEHNICVMCNVHSAPMSNICKTFETWNHHFTQNYYIVLLTSAPRRTSDSASSGFSSSPMWLRQKLRFPAIRFHWVHQIRSESVDMFR